MKRVALVLAILVVATLLIWMLGGRSPVRQTAEASAAAPPAVAVTAYTVRASKVPLTVALSGTVRSARTAVLSTRLSGLITTLDVVEGSRVAAGQVIATVDVSSVEAQSAQAAANVALAEAAAREADAGTARWSQAIASADARRQEMQAQLREAGAALRQAEIDQKRARYMLAHDAVPKSDLDRADTAVAMARARVASAQAGVRGAEAERGQAQASLAQSRLTVSKARTGIEVARTAIAIPETDMPYGTLRAPFTGAVTKKMADAGEVTTPGRPLVQIEDTRNLHLDLVVPEEELQSIKAGQRLEVRFDSRGKTVKGHVSEIIPSADPASRTFIAKIELPSGADVLPGVYGRVRLPHGERTALRVPVSAVLVRGQIENVFVIEGEIARLRPVRTRPIDGRFVEIVSGLAEGDRVVTDAHGVEDGTAVKAQRND
jgi:multidrug efflux pump subunit AcrA (membrane-fusion protein)